MKAGDPADDADAWYRAVNNSTHVRRGRFHHAEFKRWLSPPDDPQKSWKLEVSGDLLSLVDDIAKRAEKYVESQRNRLKSEGKPVPSIFQFCGVLYVKVAKIRSLAQFRCDVIYDPLPDDDAHANIVVFDKGPDEILTVSDALSENLVWVPKDQISTDRALSSA